MSATVTVTLNPTFDTTATAERVETDRKIYCDEATQDPGGGGINVARAIAEFGGSSVAVWLRGGMFGDALDQMLKQSGIDHTPVEIDGENRQSFAVVEQGSDRHFRFSTPGPTVTDEALDALIDVVGEQDPEILVLSGGLPDGVPDDFYARLVSSTASNGTTVVLDTHGAPLRAALDGGGIDIVKPNYRELAEVVGVDLETEDPDVVEAARSLIGEDQASTVIVSLGAAGAVLVTADDARRLSAPTVTIRSRIGAGDSMVAGLVHELARGEDMSEATRFAVAAGAAAVMTPGTRLCRATDVERLLGDVTIE